MTISLSSLCRNVLFTCSPTYAKKNISIEFFFEYNFFVKILTLIVLNPTLVGREELYTQLVFLFGQFWPTDIIIVENYEKYH